MMINRSISLLSLFFATSSLGLAQVITTAVPFLSLTPDARSAGMGDAGTAISGDQNAIYWNPGRLATVTKDLGGSVSVTPWLRGLGVNDVYLGYLSGYYKINKQSAVGLGFTYFNLGGINLTDINGVNMGSLNPNEFSICPTYSRILSKNLSLGVGLKYFHSNLAGSYSNSGDATRARPANSVAVDFGMHYTKEIGIGGNPAQYGLGIVLANLGPQISYTDNNRRDFIPSMLRVGNALTMDLDPYNKVTFTLELSKLLVPTPAWKDTANYKVDDSWIGGMVESLYKAPNGTSEKLDEILISAGAEYWYDNQFAIRGGYFHENKMKGNRRYFTAGVGIRYQTFGLDFAYLIPVQTNHPLAETLRFSLLFDLNLPKKEESVTDKASGPGAE